MTDPYELLPEDTEYLDASYPGKWRKLCEGPGKFGLLIESFPVPDGYRPEASDLMVLVPSGYPGSPLDMFYFCPELGKTGGSAIGAIADECHFGRRWQRWSRHYKWTPGRDNVVSHIEYVSSELRLAAAS